MHATATCIETDLQTLSSANWLCKSARRAICVRCAPLLESSFESARSSCRCSCAALAKQCGDELRHPKPSRHEREWLLLFSFPSLLRPSRIQTVDRHVFEHRRNCKVNENERARTPHKTFLEALASLNNFLKRTLLARGSPGWKPLLQELRGQEGGHHRHDPEMPSPV